MILKTETRIERFVDHFLPSAKRGCQLLYENFGQELKDYTEFVLGKKGTAIGLGFGMEGRERAAFTKEWFQQIEMGEPFLRWFELLAAQCEYKRMFLKAEWTREAVTDPTFDSYPTRIGFYYRRRPQVDDLLDVYMNLGMQPEVAARLKLYAQILGKKTIHFVAVASEKGGLPKHKWYFSQYITPETGSRTLENIKILFGIFGFQGADANHILEACPLLIGSDFPKTLFVSFSFDMEKLLPDLKLDFQEPDRDAINPILRNLGWGSREVPDLEDLSGSKSISYVGIRLCEQEEISVKLYADAFGE